MIEWSAHKALHPLRKRAKLVNVGLDWMGPVPHDWKIRRLGHFFVERRQKVSDRDFAPLSVTMAGVVPQLEHVAKTDDGDNRKLTCAGDFVINSRSDRKGSGGVAPRDGSVSLINTVLEPTGELGIDFAAYLLTSYPFQEEFYRVGNGIVADMWTTKYAEMRNIRVACPSPDEQHRISSFLDRETARIDALVKHKTRFVALLREKRQALITRAVTRGLDADAPMKDSGVEWLGQVPASWQVVALRHVCSALEQGWSPDCDSRMADSGEWGVLKSGCVNGGIFNPSENKALPKSIGPRQYLEIRDGDVLMSRANGSKALIGSVAYVAKPPPMLMMSDKIFRLVLNEEMNRHFFALAMGSTPLRVQIEQAIGGADGLANNLSQENIKRLWVPVPSLDEQSVIVEHVDMQTTRIDVLITKTERSIALLREKRTALITAAVTGKIDLAAAA